MNRATFADAEKVVETCVRIYGIGYSVALTRANCALLPVKCSALGSAWGHFALFSPFYRSSVHRS
ncbi:MAG: hypothetical protein PHF65_02060 [Oscillospiraceae bacterium]|jgi:hypothetical protein|nr:hypothetical protein [Oscillospiraceae bacterium]